MTYPRNPLFAFYADVQSSARTFADAFKDNGPIFTKLDELTNAVKDIPGQSGSPDFGEYRDWLIVNTFLLPALDHHGDIWMAGSSRIRKTNILGSVYLDHKLEDACAIADCDLGRLQKILHQYIEKVGFMGWAGEIGAIAEIVQKSAYHICGHQDLLSEKPEAS